MSCSVNRWGTGTTCERPSNTEAAKELQTRIAAMAQERAKQDAMWTQSSAKPASSDISESITSTAAPTTKGSDTR